MSDFFYAQSSSTQEMLLSLTYICNLFSVCRLFSTETAAKAAVAGDTLVEPRLPFKFNQVSKFKVNEIE